MTDPMDAPSPDAPALTALALVCSLKPSPAPSSSQLMAEQVLEALGEHGVTGPTVRLADLDIHPGVEADKGNGDEWPSVRDQILAADILVFSTPTWMGHMSSIAQRALERLDWNGEAMHTVDYKDLDSVPEEVASTTSALAANAAHLARLLQKQGYPAQS